MNKFPEHKSFDLSQINKDVLKKWKEAGTFEKSLLSRKNSKPYIFYEGPPSANGMPGIHHVMARAIKDVFCRYKTLRGYLVERKAGWDTHGLPVELGVEKALGITKEDIGTKITVEEYNQACRTDVMKYTDHWENLTDTMGFWLDMSDPYITYDNRYIETLWYLLKELHKKGLLYKGYTIQPFSPAAGTGLSTHELNQPGCYKTVKDTTVVAQFKIIKNSKSEFLFADTDCELFFLAWTTTPWTLPSNTALAVGDIPYLKVRTFNPYTGKPVIVILAKALFNIFFAEKNKDIPLNEYKEGNKDIPYKILSEYNGKEFDGIRYEQLMPYIQPTDGDAFKVILGDFVTTEDGTGIVHIAPSFGADDFRMSKQYGLGTLTLVNRQGKFVEGMGELSGRYVKNAYDATIPEGTNEVDVDIAVILKKENKAFRIEKYEHNYPHCWRTDKPIIYYPLDSWFIKTTAVKDRMIELNNTINWKPASTGFGRFGKWLENLVDWNLSRSRFWGTPLPIWVTENRSEIKCIGSVAELKAEMQKSFEAGFMTENPLAKFEENNFTKDNYSIFDLHRPYVDKIILVSADGKKMMREPDLIDVWFDSGAMPYAQLHYPFEHKDDFHNHYPADFIAEGVDQTRGWFFTLHAIAVMLFDTVSYKTVISNGLVLDKAGNKMSKRLGNAVDPFTTIEKHGSDPLRWYMISNSQPWDDLCFDEKGIDEVKRKFFGTLYNTYSFFALYANVDNFTYAEPNVPANERPELDRWILSLLNSLIKDVGNFYNDYEPTKAARAIQDFVSENMSNWFVRLSRKRYWGGEYSKDKISAYQTLYTCIETIAVIASPIAPFYMDKLYCELNEISKKHNSDSVHLASFPAFNENLIDKALEERMDLAQKVSSMVLSLRRKVNIKVRQPLSKIMIPVLDEAFETKIEAVKNIILTETNIKEIEYLKDATGILVKKIKANFKTLGPRYGKIMKSVAAAIAQFSQQDISNFEKQGGREMQIEGQTVVLIPEDVEIMSEDIPGWLVTNDGSLTVALDINVTDSLREEGIAREFINRIQNLRKENRYDVTDKIIVEIQQHDQLDSAIKHHISYICLQTLAVSINLVEKLEQSSAKSVEIEDNLNTFIKIAKANQL